MNFIEAVTAMKEGIKVCKESWINENIPYLRIVGNALARDRMLKQLRLED